MSGPSLPGAETLRPEHGDDAPAVHALHELCFPTAAEAELVDALRAAGGLSVSLVATHGDEVVGHIAMSPVTIEGRVVGLGLAPVAVLPPCRRKGVAARLIRRGLALCRQLGVGLVVVLGNPHYYSRFGFVAASSCGLKDEYEGGDAFQVIELVPGALPREGGLVRYAAEFAALPD